MWQAFQALCDVNIVLCQYIIYQTETLPIGCSAIWFVILQCAADFRIIRMRINSQLYSAYALGQFNQRQIKKYFLMAKQDIAESQVVVLDYAHRRRINLGNFSGIDNVENDCLFRYDRSGKCQVFISNQNADDQDVDNSGNGAVEKSRTSTNLRSQRPQRCASTNSATTASVPLVPKTAPRFKGNSLREG